MLMRLSNLFPHRIVAKKRRLRRFVQQLVMSVLLVITAAMGVQTWTDYRIDEQKARNQMLQTEISSLGADLPTPLQIKQEQQQLRIRKNLLQALMAEKSQPIRLFNALASNTPAGVQLLDVQQNSNELYLSGVATSHERVAEFMRRLVASEVFEQAELKEVQSASDPSAAAAMASPSGGAKRADQKLERFSLRVLIKAPTQASQ
jgi:type IV pilus assembly protein PilN